MTLKGNIMRARGRLAQLKGELETLKISARGDLLAINDVVDGMTPFLIIRLEDLETAHAQMTELVTKRRRAEEIRAEIQELEKALDG